MIVSIMQKSSTSTVLNILFDSRYVRTKLNLLVNNFLTRHTHMSIPRSLPKYLMVNFLLRKNFRGNLNETISANKIASFRFPLKIFLKRKLTIKSTHPSFVFRSHSSNTRNIYNELYLGLQWNM